MKNTEACKLLNEALATEIVCVMRYRHHQVIARGRKFLDISEELAEHAQKKEENMIRLAERIDQLGGNPDFNPDTVIERSLCSYNSQMGDDLEGFMQDDRVAERLTNDVYTKLIQRFGDEDQITKMMLEDFVTE